MVHISVRMWFQTVNNNIHDLIVLNKKKRDHFYKEKFILLLN